MPEQKEQKKRLAWQDRALAAGLNQKMLARLLGLSEVTVSNQMRERYGETSRSIAAAIIAWEMLTLDQREEWLAQLDGSHVETTGRRLVSEMAQRLRAQIVAGRQRLGLSRQQVGSAVGLNRKQVAMFEEGSDVSFSTAVRIAEALGLTFSLIPTAQAQGVTAVQTTADTAQTGMEDNAFAELPDEIPGELDMRHGSSGHEEDEP